MHVHLCDFCGAKIEQPAAVLTLAPELPPAPDDPTDSRNAYKVFEIRAHVEAVRPPRPAVPDGWGSDVLSRMFKDPGVP